jgi:hypothetical protein
VRTYTVHVCVYVHVCTYNCIGHIYGPTLHIKPSNVCTCTRVYILRPDTYVRIRIRKIPWGLNVAPVVDKFSHGLWSQVILRYEQEPLVRSDLHCSAFTDPTSKTTSNKADKDCPRPAKETQMLRLELSRLATEDVWPIRFRSKGMARIEHRCADQGDAERSVVC